MINIKGKGSVGIAVAFFSLNGLVSIPLEAHEYNILYDDGKDIYKIKVISTSYKSPYGVYTVNIRSMGGNMPHMKVKIFDPKSCDYVFVVTDELDMYNIPSEKIESTRSISLKVYEKFKVNLGDVV